MIFACTLFFFGYVGYAAKVVTAFEASDAPLVAEATAPFAASFALANATFAAAKAVFAASGTTFDKLFTVEKTVPVLKL